MAVGLSLAQVICVISQVLLVGGFCRGSPVFAPPKTVDLAQNELNNLDGIDLAQNEWNNLDGP